MYPYLFRFDTPWGGEINIASYGVMMMIGFLLSLYVLQKRAQKHGIASDKIFNVALAMIICGVIGARIFYIIQFWEADGFADNPFQIIRIDRGGLVFFGGLIGGVAGAFAFMWKERLPFAETSGLIASVGPLGHAFGRMGCFLNGCCGGRITESWVGIRFPSLDVSVHPTQLYAVGYNLLIFALLSWWLRRRNRPLELAGLYMITYGSARFINEFFRATEPVLTGLSIAQIVSIPLATAGAALLLYRKRAPVRSG